MKTLRLTQGWFHQTGTRLQTGVQTERLSAIRNSKIAVSDSVYRVYSDLITLSQRQDILFPLSFEFVHISFCQNLL